MKLLIISSFYLFDKTQVGGSRRLFHLVEALAQRAEVDLFCLDACREGPTEGARAAGAVGAVGADGARAETGWKVGLEGVRKIGARTTGVPQGLRDFDWAPVQAADAGLARLWSPPNRIRRSLQMHTGRFARFVGRRYDAVLLAFPWALDAFDAYWKTGNDAGTPTLPFFYLEDDLVLEWYARVEMESAGQAAPVTKRLRRLWKQHQVGVMARDYRRKLRAARGFIAISKEEGAVAKGHFPWLETWVLPHALPMQLVPFLAKASVPQRIGFLANFDHTPNRVALDFLLKQFLPALRAAAPDVELVLAGKGLPTEIAEPGCICLGTVSDVADFYREIGVLVNPVTTGRGLRTKVIEAAAYGCLIVSTRLGREGIDDLDITEAGTAESFVAEALRLLKAEDYETRRRRNRERAEQFYGVDAIAGGMLLWMHGQLARLGAGTV
jgi:glycosyltransferase involved in cell wall biosynthesis